MSDRERIIKNLEYELDKIIEKSSKTETALEIVSLGQPIVLMFLNLLREQEKDKAKIMKLEKENRKLKVVRSEYDYGYENTYFITKNDLVQIDKNKYLIEIEEGKFVDLKQVYLDNKNDIPKQKIKDAIEKIAEYKIARETNKGYYYDYFINQDYKEDFIKLFNKLLED